MDLASKSKASPAESEKSSPIQLAEEGLDISQETDDPSSLGKIPWSYKWLALLCIVSLPIGHTWTGSALGPLKNTLREELGINNAQFGVISSADAFVNTVFPIIGGLILDWWGPNLVTICCTSVILVGSVVAAVGVQINLWRVLVSGHVLMGFGIAFFYHWFGVSGLAFAFGLENAIANTVSLVSGMVAIPIKNGTGWYGWTFWIPVFFCVFSLAVNIAYVCFERFVIPARFRLTPGREKAIAEKHLSKKGKFSWNVLFSLPWAYLMLPATQLLQSGAAGGFSTSSADMIFMKGFSEEVAGYLATAQKILPIVLSPVVGLAIDRYGHRFHYVATAPILWIIACSILGFTDLHPTVALVFSSLAGVINAMPLQICIPLLVADQAKIGTAFGMDVVFGALQDDTDGGGYEKVLLVAIGIKAWAFFLALSYIFVDFRFLGKGMTMTLKQREAREAEIVDRDADPLTKRTSKPWFTIMTFGLLIAIIASAWAVFLSSTNNMASSAKRPNFLIIVADDLGFSDTGPYGSEISTPALDRLAKDGVRMTDFHTAPACSPTRAMLMSGTDNHVAGLGQMAEFMATNAQAFKGHPGYEGYLNFRIAALPEILQDAGYFTAMSGKWHLGLKPEHSPSARGFTKSVALLPGAGNHFNYEPDFDPDLNYPSFMKSEGLWMEDGRVIDRKSELPHDFYSTNYFTNRLLQFLDERTPVEAEQPFFAYLAYTAPHWPLQAPKHIIEKYRGMYSDGPDELRMRRIKQLRSLGLIPEDAIPAPVSGTSPEWKHLSASEQAESARKMEVYAAMVDVMDQNIGRVLDRLEATGELDNTFVVFMSDNGAEGALLEAIPIMRSIGLLEALQNHFDNSMDNLGNANSFFWYGPRWASAATAPSRGFKGFTTEGGIRCPCIVRYPGFQSNGNYQISHDFTTVMDILPTCLELAGVQAPGKTFRGREIAPIRGKSWVSYLSGAKPWVYDANLDVTGWELFGLRGIRRGNFKAVLVPLPRGSGEWELYNVARDPGELKNLAHKKKSILNELLMEWENYFAETGMFEFDIKNRNVRGV
ncbi:hypothetical protein G7Z17_g725 [Cylindrodendrum hubeiense]|uniref:Sulfatase N-terminal domain-containing protein n=1 Tax=Cylindrodendrum hubeiense TaxID=595255 RepID=A0A9P5HGF0_9HYPO|nr:hypothetical protein G7Z17_g725 [Cylindrodendrum hubeiense]